MKNEKYAKLLRKNIMILGNTPSISPKMIQNKGDVPISKQNAKPINIYNDNNNYIFQKINNSLYNEGIKLIGCEI